MGSLFHTAGVMKTVPSVYTYVINTDFTAEGTVFRKNTVAGCSQSWMHSKLCKKEEITNYTSLVIIVISTIAIYLSISLSIDCNLFNFIISQSIIYLPLREDVKIKSEKFHNLFDSSYEKYSKVMESGIDAPPLFTETSALFSIDVFPFIKI